MAEGCFGTAMQHAGALSELVYSRAMPVACFSYSTHAELQSTKKFFAVIQPFRWNSSLSKPEVPI